MVQISPENDKDEEDIFEVPVGAMPKGGRLVVRPTHTGLYKIEFNGVGAAPKITNQLFTSLLLAKRAVDNFMRANASAYAKEALKNRIATGPSIKEQRKAEALALKNGELEKLDPDDDES